MSAGDAPDEHSRQAQQIAVPAPVYPQVPPLAANSIPTGPADLNSAQLEAMNLAQGRLEQAASVSNHTRRESMRDVIHKLKLAFLILTSSLVLIAIVVVALHWMTPWVFLSAAQLSTLQTMLSSSVITGVATVMGKNILKDM